MKQIKLSCIIYDMSKFGMLCFDSSADTVNNVEMIVEMWQVCGRGKFTRYKLVGLPKSDWKNVLFSCKNL